MKKEVLMVLVMFLLSSCSNTDFDKKISVTSDVTKTSYYEKPTNKTIDECENKENIYIAANELINNTKYYTTSVSGSVKANVAFVKYTQDVYNTKIYNDGDIFVQSLSLSLLKKVAVQRYIHSNNYLERRGSNPSKYGAQWSDNIISYSKDEYIEKYGAIPHNFTSYILNDETIKEISKDVVDDSYIFSLTLDEEIATFNYRHEVKTMANANSFPLFSSVSIKIHLDYNWKITELHTTEEYNIDLFGGITCVQTLTEKFTYPTKFIENEFIDDFTSNNS